MASKRTNNPNGRPKGSFNHKNAFLRAAINEIIEDNLEGLKDDLEALAPRDRVASLTQLMQFVLPKLQSIDMDIDAKNKDKYEQAIDQLAGIGEDNTESTN